MKLQDVLWKAMAKKISWGAAAKIIGISDPTMRRWHQHGYDGLMDRRKGKGSTHRVAVKTVEEVLRLYREKYYDLNMRHFHEKLSQEHQIELSYTWVQKALQGAGLAAKMRRRPRRAMPGMLLHIDGSKHGWLNDERWYDLIVILDDATSEKGLFCAFYSDRGSHFFVTPKAGEKLDKHRLIPTFPPRRRL